MRSNSEPKGSSMAVHYVYDILSAFNEQVEEIGVNAISKKLGVHPGTVHRLMTTLREVGILEQNPATKKYRLGLRIFEIGILYSHHMRLRKIVRPHLESLASNLNINCHLGILSQNSITIIDRVHNLQSPSLIQRLSVNVPLHCSGVGKALLAFLPQERQNELIDQIAWIPYTEKTIMSREVLKEELHRIVKQGYSVDREELHGNITCVGVPILDKNSNVLASISVTDLSDRLTENRIEEICRFLKKTAEFISRQV